MMDVCGLRLMTVTKRLSYVRLRLMSVNSEGRLWATFDDCHEAIKLFTFTF